MNLKQMTNDLRHEKEVLEKKIYDLIKEFELDTEMEVKEIYIQRTQSFVGKPKQTLWGIKITSAI